MVGQPRRFLFPQARSFRRRVRRQHRLWKTGESRRLHIESLEPRTMLDGSWQNPFNRLDINGDGVVVPIDPLISINELNNRQFIDSAGKLPDRSLFPNAAFYDINNDGLLVPLDVLPIINAYNDDDDSPTVIVRLVRDTAPNNSTNTDRLTSDPRISGTVIDVTGVSRLIAMVDSGPERVVTVAPDGTFQFDPSPTADGEHTIQFAATDGRRNPAALSEVKFQLDTDAPTASSNLQGVLRRSFSSFQVDFDDALPAAVFVPASFTLRVDGGPTRH